MPPRRSPAPMKIRSAIFKNPDFIVGCVYYTKNKTPPVHGQAGCSVTESDGPRRKVGASLPALSSSAAGRTRFHRACFVHRELPPTEILSVPEVDRFLRVCIIDHFNEAEPLGATGHLVGDNRGGLNRTRLRERVFQLVLRRRVGKSPHVQSLCHLFFFGCVRRP